MHVAQLVQVLSFSLLVELFHIFDLKEEFLRTSGVGAVNKVMIL